MLSKKIFLSEDVNKHSQIACETLIHFLGSTLGPKGGNGIFTKNGRNNITNDGVTLAAELELEHPVQNQICSLIYEVAKRTNDLAGDGTTTTSVLACQLIISCKQILQQGYANASLLKSGLDKISNYLVNELKKLSHPLKDEKAIFDVALVSSGANEMGEIIKDAVTSVKENGIIICKEGTSNKTFLELEKGLSFDKGMFSAYFSNDNAKFICNEGVIIFVCDLVLSTQESMTKILQSYLNLNTKKGLLIICEDLKGDAMLVAVGSKIRNGLNICVVKAPSFGVNKSDLLQDICCLTGAKFLSESLGYTLDNIDTTYFGTAAAVKVTSDNTTIVAEKGFESEISERVNSIKNILEQTLDSPENLNNINRMKDRIAKLSGGVAVIHVGGNTETEIKAKKLKMDDALNATRSALEEGVVAGGGAVYLHLLELLRKQTSSYVSHEIHIDEITTDLELGNGVYLKGDEVYAVSAVVQACLSPISIILKNAGITSIKQIIAECYKKDKCFSLFDERVVNARERGIIDSAKVVRCSIENAFSIAGLIVNTNVSICESLKTEEKSAPNEFY